MQRRTPSLPVVLATVGTDGDIYPFLELGRTLRDRGHRVTLATHEHFRGRAADAGIAFRTLVTQDETETLLKNPGLWHPHRGPLVLAGWGSRLIQRQYRVLREAAIEPNVRLIASPGVVAARVVQEAARVPLTSLVLQPWLIPSVSAPPTMMGGLSLPAWSPHMARRVYYRLFNAMGSLLIGSELARLRRPLQLPRIRRMFHWWFSPDLMIGLFPSWFGTPQDDWPSQLTLAGFPRGDSGRVRDLSASTEEFLKAGTPPVVFTFGTGMKHATRLFRQCLEACRQIGMRSIFITQYQDQLPLPLPSFALHGSFEPFAALFARCAAIVHHGGIGTTAAALAAGTPQLILPFAFDQLDNARRVHGQGMGTWLDRRHRSSTEIANTLAVLTAEFPRERGAALIARCRECDGLARAADIFEERG